MQGPLAFARDNLILKIKFISKTVKNRYSKYEVLRDNLCLLMLHAN